jgi:antitoxin MazE
MTVRAKLVRIGNSKGLRLPKAVVEACGLENDVLLEARRGRLIVKPAAAPRRDWDQRFQRVRARPGDALIETPPSSWDRTEWEW